MDTVTVTLTEIDVKQSGGDAKFFIQTEFKDGGEDGFRLTLTDGLHVWDGALSEDEMDQLSTKRKMDFNSYVEQTRAAFTKEKVADLYFEYHLSQPANKGATFVWKKHIVADDIKFQLGSIKLKECDQPAKKLCQLLTGCVLRSQQLHTQIRTLTSDNERLSLDRQNALKRLDKCVTAKEEMEKDLYSKFSAVLNSKKERIRQLVENGSPSLIDDDPSTSGTMDVGQGEDKVVTDSPLRDHRDDYDIDTDEEEIPKKRRKAVKANQVKLSAEASVNLGEGDEEMDLEEKKAPVARRPRRQAPTKKQTPAKPVLPRVSTGSSSGIRPGSAGRSSSLRKSGSQRSNKSSDSWDPDDLMDNL